MIYSKIDKDITHDTQTMREVCTMIAEMQNSESALKAKRESSSDILKRPELNASLAALWHERNCLVLRSEACDFHGHVTDIRDKVYTKAFASCSRLIAACSVVAHEDVVVIFGAHKRRHLVVLLGTLAAGDAIALWHVADDY